MRYSAATAINERGQVVGTAWNSGDPSSATHAFLWEKGRMRDLGSLPGYPYGEPAAINERGQVVGTVHSADKASNDWGSRFSHAFLWENGKMRDLGVLPGGKYSGAVAISGRGQIVGWSGTATADADGYHGYSHAFLWENGAMRDLGTLPGGRYSEATKINASGRIIGYSVTKIEGDSGGHSSFEPRAWRAVLWEDGKMRDLGALPSNEAERQSEAVAINPRGQVVGCSGYVFWQDRAEFCSWGKAFLWEDGRLRSLGTLGGVYSGVSDINDRDQIIGHSSTSSGDEHAVVWDNGKTYDLGTLPGVHYSYATDINEREQIVGYSPTGKWDKNHQLILHAVLWTLKPGS